MYATKTILASLLFACATTGTALAAPAAAEPFYMKDVQATVNLPPGWEMSRWSDWDFRAKTKDGGIQMNLSFTPYQVDPSQEAADGWVKLHTKTLEEVKAVDVKPERTEVVTVAGRTVDRVDLSFKFSPTGPDGLWQSVAIPACAKTIHIALISNLRNVQVAEDALEYLVEHIAMERDADPLDEYRGPVAVEKAQYATTLPATWRRPTPAEMPLVVNRIAKLGHDQVNPDKCFVAIHPLPNADPDLMMFCQSGLYLDKVDEHSWDGVEAAVYDRFFAKKTETPHAEKILVGDRLGFFYRTPAPNDQLLVAIAPFNKGILLGWGLAAKDRGEPLEAAMKATLTDMKFTGPEGGVQPVGIAKYVEYIVKYRQSSPMFWGPIAGVGILLLLVVVLLLRRKKEKPDYSKYETPT
ncbi:MAG: hypothetical protein JXB39_04990 [Deltaproteobacteria bacterium]|nr:hypothetical protein [Deltaproteobacteria bacterium]